MNKKVKDLFQTDIYGILCEALSGGKTNPDIAQEMVDAGIRIIQYREKDKPKKEKLLECEKISGICRRAGVLFIVNDDADIAVLSQAGGLHLGQEDLPADKVRKLTGDDMIIGVSAETPREVEEAMRQSADYVGVGPVFATETKKDAGNPLGLEKLAFLAQSFPIPIVAIGGINEDNISAVNESGAACSAMVSALVGSNDMAGTVRRIRLKIASFKPD